MFLSVCLNPVLQKTLVIDSFHANEVNRSKEYRLDISGKGVNVSRVLVQLGESVVHLTHLGGIFKAFFLRRAGEDKIPIVFANTSSEIRFGMTLCARDKRSSTEIIEEGEGISPGTEKKVMRLFAGLLRRVHTVILSGKKASGYSDDVFPGMVMAAKKAGKTVICDYRGEDLLSSIKYRPDIIKPNLREFVMTFFPGEIKDFHRLEILDAINEKMLELSRDHKVHCVLTDGDRAIRYCDQNRIAELIPGAISPVNTIGSGDAFAAGLASSYHATGRLSDAVAQGEECARKNALVLKPGSIR